MKIYLHGKQKLNLVIFFSENLVKCIVLKYLYYNLCNKSNTIRTDSNLLIIIYDLIQVQAKKVEVIIVLKRVNITIRPTLTIRKQIYNAFSTVLGFHHEYKVPLMYCAYMVQISTALRILWLVGPPLASQIAAENK